ncbi:MAG: OPT/YSL family transporter [Gemmatimonadetes bacterium]|nr:OPT/YSL family transporter [Gemmatimonadota bacterium]
MSEPSFSRPPEQIHDPLPNEAQFTFRAVATGCLLGLVISSMNIYFGLRTGWSIGGSLIAAILGYSIWSAIHRASGARAYTVLETNITQTSGSAAGAMTSAAGLLSAIPALGMLGTKLSYGELVMWAFAVGYLGVFYAVPLRNQMVVVEKLRFPTGTATAETIISMFAKGSTAVAQASALVRWAIAAALFTIVAFFVPQIQAPPMEWIGLAAIGAWGFSIYISPLMLGAGILIGPRVGASLFAGAVVSWAIIGPIAQANGWAEGSIMSYQDGPRGWILWPGVAIMVADALTNLALSWRTILNTFKRSDRANPGTVVVGEQVPNSWWLIGLTAGTVLAAFVAWRVFEIPPYMTVIAVAMSSILAMIAVRSTGETDINPVGGMGKVTQLVFGGISPGNTTTNLMAAAVTSAGASQAGDMMHDLKAGRLLGASPRKQILAQCIGIAAGIPVCTAIYKLFDTAYEIGGTELPAPAAHAWRAMAELLSNGFDQLPPNAEIAILCGALFGVLMPVLRKYAPALRPILPSGLAFGIAFIVPAFYSVAMFIGSLLLVLWKSRAPQSAKIFAIAVASGLIAGEGLMGVVTAVLTLLGLGPLT